VEAEALDTAVGDGYVVVPQRARLVAWWGSELQGS
jgi:hypothetical protein